MANLSDQLAATSEASRQRLPADVAAVMQQATVDLKSSGIEDRAVKTGQNAPDFTLNNHLNQPRNLKAMLTDGPLVVSFYRGGW